MVLRTNTYCKCVLLREQAGENEKQVFAAFQEMQQMMSAPPPTAKYYCTVIFRVGEEQLAAVTQ